MKKKLLVFAAACSMAFSVNAQNWSEVTGQLSGSAHTFIPFNNLLFVGGNFSKVDNKTCAFSATYDGSKLERITTEQFGGGGFTCFAVHKGKLYGGGTSTVGSISFGAAMLLEWNAGTKEWGNSAYRLHSNVYALASFNEYLVVGGNFNTEDGTDYNYIARHNGTAYSTMGDGFNNPVSSLAVANNTLYAAGGFSKSGTTSVNQLAKWNGTAWVDAGNTLDLESDLVVFKNELYVLRKKANDDVVLSKWNGTAWTDFPEVFEVGPNGIRSVIADDNAIYFGGDLDKVGSLEVKNIVSFDGTAFSALGNGIEGIVNALGVYKGNLYAAKSAFEENNLLKFALTTGVNSAAFAAMPVSVYPNPANQQVTIGKALSDEAVVSVYTAQGRLVEQYTGSNSTLSLSGLVPGIYLLRVTDKDGIYTAHIVKN